MSSGLSLRIGQEINLSEASGENHISPETVSDKWWYKIQPNGGKTPLAYCNATLCSDILRPEFKTRMEINGMSLILKKVKLADKGLRLQCRIVQNNKPLPLLYNVIVKNVSVNPTTGQSSCFFPETLDQPFTSDSSPIFPSYNFLSDHSYMHLRMTSYSLSHYPDKHFMMMIIIIIVFIIIIIIIIIISNILDGLVSEFCVIFMCNLFVIPPKLSQQIQSLSEDSGLSVAKHLEVQ